MDVNGLFKSFLLISALVISADIFAQQPKENSESSEPLWSYGERGLQFESVDGNNFLWFGVRLQTRYSNQEVSQDSLPDEPTTRSAELKLNRGRFKIGGHLVSPAFTVYTEYDFPTERLLDLRGTYEFSDKLSLRIGQWKSQYNRERIDSSGAQQFVERSVATPWFTIDRQKAVMASGRAAAGSAIDSSYWLGFLSGAGRGGALSDAKGLWMGRYQWNFAGEVLGFSQSDLADREKGTGSIALALIDGKTQYTAFSSEGGGQLPGYEGGAKDRYHLRQVVIETAYQKNGFSWQQEFHWKYIVDSTTGIENKVIGGYAQAGIFLSRIFPRVPRNLEVAIRYAAVAPDESIQENHEREATIVGNWFFNGHRNKLSLDISYLHRQFVPDTNKTIRVRVQWDWSF